jgi:chemotaxis protein MotA
MFVIIGYVFAIAMILGGYVGSGGHVSSLWQPLEIVMIGGGAFGAFIVANGGKPLKATLKALPKLFKGSMLNKAFYMELLAMMSEVLDKMRREGLMAIEADVENPHDSPIFSKYHKVSHDHHLMEFLTDYLRLMLTGTLNAMELENMMQGEIDTHHHEAEVPIHAIEGLGDGMPAFGIVAAVMGVVHTMESADKPPAVLGQMIATALVGTFLGILLAYGFITPLAKVLHHKMHEESKVYECIKVTLLASINGYPPQLALEFGRKALFSTERPTFAELEEHIKQAKSGGGG